MRTNTIRPNLDVLCMSCIYRPYIYYAHPHRPSLASSAAYRRNNEPANDALAEIAKKENRKESNRIVNEYYGFRTIQTKRYKRPAAHKRQFTKANEFRQIALCSTALHAANELTTFWLI